MNTFAWILISLGVIATWHFIYEGILLPSLRQDLRFQLFSLRDRLRILKSDCPEQCGNEAFHVLDDSLSWQMDNQVKLTIALMLESQRRMSRDSKFAERVKNRTLELDSCELPEFLSVKKEAADLFKQAVLFNSGGWLVYLIPAAVVAASMAKIAEGTRLLLGVPERELNRMAHCPA